MSNIDSVLATEDALKVLFDEMMELKSATELVQQAGVSTQQVVHAAEQVTKTAVNVYEQSSQLLAILDKAQIDEKLSKLENEIDRFYQSLLKIKADIETQRDELFGRHLENIKKIEEMESIQGNCFSNLEKRAKEIQTALESIQLAMDNFRQDVFERISSVSTAQNNHFETIVKGMKDLDEQYPVVLDQLEHIKQKNEQFIQSLHDTAEQSEDRDRTLETALETLQKYSKVNRILISFGIGTSIAILGLMIFSLIR